MIRSPLILLITSIAMLSSAAIAASPDWQSIPNLTKASLTESIKRRQMAVTSASFTWTEDCFYVKGMFNNLRRKRAGDPTLDIPQEDQYYTQSHKFLFEGEKTAHESTTHLLKLKTNEFYNEIAQNTFDGFECRMLKEPDLQNEFPYGRIYPKGKPNIEIDLLTLEPIYQCYHLCSNRLPILNIDRFEIDPAGGDINGTRCIILSDRKSPNSGVNRSYWIDPARNHLILRFVVQNERYLQRRTNFEYVNHAEHGWVPNGWLIESFDESGAITQSIEASVSEFQINPAVSPTDFTIQFPVGTYVDDLPTKGFYIQKENGNERRILVSEKGASYNTLLNTESGMAATQPVRTQSRLLLIAAVFCVLSTGIYLSRRNLKSM